MKALEPISRTLVVTAVGVVGGTLYAHFVRGYPWYLALFLGAAIGALVFSIQRTGSRLRSTAARRNEPSDE